MDRRPRRDHCRAPLAAGPALATPEACQREIAKRSARFVQAKTRALQRCEANRLAGKISGSCPDHKTTQQIERAAATLTQAIARRCGGADGTCGTPDDLGLAAIGWDLGNCPGFVGSRCIGAIASCADVAACVRCIDDAAVDQASALAYRTFTPPLDDVVRACQQAIGAESARFLTQKTKALQQCADAVLQGKRAGPCPDGATLATIAKRETTLRARICKRCGGADATCDGTDDLAPAAIGFAATCPAVRVPGGASCASTVTTPASTGTTPASTGTTPASTVTTPAGTVATLADLVDCVACVHEFDADCSDAAAVPALTPYPPVCAGGQCQSFTPVRRPYFGDTHVHTTYSLDASTQGTMMSPAQAYRFARGEPVPIQPFDEQGAALRHLQLARPLDFAVVSDHAEFFGEVTICEDPSHPNYLAPECILYRQNPDQAFLLFNFLVSTPPLPQPDGSKRGQRFPTVCGLDGSACVTAAATPWGIIQEDANAAYDACEFTTLIGYEWTTSPQSYNLHRNVFFANTAVPAVPASFFEAPDPELLWAALDRDCHDAIPGCRATTVPHNSNVSGGLMFKTTDGNDQPFTPAYAAARNRFEPLVEIFQHKGDSECYRLSGPGAEDELCGFEKFPYNNLIFDRFGGAGTGPPGETDFVRDALKTGLQLEETLGVNPFKYGIIASSDTHLGAPGAVVERDFPGHGGAGSAPRGELPAGLADNVAFNPGGLAVVWAEENTREALFAAIERREAYGTSGPRITLRFFGGWHYDAAMCAAPAGFASAGYLGGVAMGNDATTRDAARYAVLREREERALAAGMRELRARYEVQIDERDAEEPAS